LATTIGARLQALADGGAHLRLLEVVVLLVQLHQRRALGLAGVEHGVLAGLLRPHRLNVEAEQRDRADRHPEAS
jgi:hypothetical protein